MDSDIRSITQENKHVTVSSAAFECMRTAVIVNKD